VAKKHDLQKFIGDIKLCRDFEMLQVKVPIDFFGTPVFSARTDGRYVFSTIVKF
jgi:hypothetical protein